MKELSFLLVIDPPLLIRHFMKLMQMYAILIFIPKLFL